MTSSITTITTNPQHKPAPRNGLRRCSRGMARTAARRRARPPCPRSTTLSTTPLMAAAVPSLPAGRAPRVALRTAPRTCSPTSPRPRSASSSSSRTATARAALECASPWTASTRARSPTASVRAVVSIRARTFLVRCRARRPVQRAASSLPMTRAMSRTMARLKRRGAGRDVVVFRDVGGPWPRCPWLRGRREMWQFRGCGGCLGARRCG